MLLSRHSNSNDIVLGTPVANRPVKELEPLVGFFVNTLVLRMDCSAGQTFREYLAHVRRVNLDAQAHQDVPFEYLVERLNPHRSTSHNRALPNHVQHEHEQGARSRSCAGRR